MSPTPAKELHQAPSITPVETSVDTSVDTPTSATLHVESSPFTFTLQSKELLWGGGGLGVILIILVLFQYILQRRSKEHIQKLHRRFDEHQDRLEAAQTSAQQLTSLQADHERLQSELQSSRDKCQKIQNQLQKLTQEWDALSQQHTELTRERDALSQQHTELTQQHTELTRERDDLSQQHTELTQQHTELTRERDALSQQHTELTKEHAELTQERDDLFQQHAELTKERDTLSQQHTELTKEHAKLTQERDDLSQQHAELTRERDALSQQHTELTQAHQGALQAHQDERTVLLSALGTDTLDDHLRPLQTLHEQPELRTQLGLMNWSQEALHVNLIPTLLHISLDPIIQRLHRTLKQRCETEERALTGEERELLNWSVEHRNINGSTRWTWNEPEPKSPLIPKSADALNQKTTGLVSEVLCPGVHEVRQMRALVKTT